LTHPECRP